MSDIKKILEGYPDISFIENMTLEDLQQSMIDDFLSKYAEETGEEIELGLADPSRLILYAASLQIYQGMQYIDNAGKQSFLKYSYDDFLDNLAAFKGIERNKGNAARTEIRFTVSAVQNSAITIPLGTRVTDGNNTFFFTTDDAEIPAGAQYVDVVAECTESGTKYNGIAVGKITTLVDTINYIGSVSNTKKTEGGSEAETDEQLAERVYLAPSKNSTAGPDDAYEYWVKTCNPAIQDTRIYSPSEGVVEIRFIMQDGAIPEGPALAEVEEFLMNEKIRPLTDFVQVKAPVIREYDINITYYIDESKRTSATAIQRNISDAVNAYKLWQCEKIGRDINPSNLIKLIMEAGAKRVEVTAPTFTAIENIEIAHVRNTTVNYGGIEVD